MLGWLLCSIKHMWISKADVAMPQKIATCSVCRKEFKNTVLRTCGHLFCRGCIDARLGNRARKCPNCNRAFGTGDCLHVTL